MHAKVDIFQPRANALKDGSYPRGPDVAASRSREFPTGMMIARWRKHLPSFTFDGLHFVVALAISYDSARHTSAGGVPLEHLAKTHRYLLDDILSDEKRQNS